jgi:hypothetical protein
MRREDKFKKTKAIEKMAEIKAKIERTENKKRNRK